MLSLHYVPYTVMNGKFTLYEADVSVAGMLSDTYIVKRAVDDAPDHEDE